MEVKLAAAMLLTMLGLPDGMQAVAPGIEGAFTITAEQRQKLDALQQEVFGAEAVAAAQKTADTKGASKADKNAARKTLRNAEAKLREKAAPVLTAEQKELAKKLNAAFTEVAKALVAEYKDKLSGGKGADTKGLGKEMTEKGKAEFAKKLDGILTAEQKAAMAKAAKGARGAKGKKGRGQMLRIRQLEQAIGGAGRRGRR